MNNKVTYVATHTYIPLATMNSELVLGDKATDDR